ncbi:flocculation protein FLO11-like [Camellia sinensis]|uniref:flocculation protein FLO11-like n=1 Tax=Camellia sinensis TaxID=4442 RepID=UPI001035AF0B|nr:flocculation protein FLO11-like [Camellia sinensis]
MAGNNTAIVGMLVAAAAAGATDIVGYCCCCGLPALLETVCRALSFEALSFETTLSLSLSRRRATSGNRRSHYFSVLGLLTPPDTPLFSYLDDEKPPVTLAQRGRPQSQPITISRSSTMGKNRKSSRGSPSPNRLSPSPRSGNSTFHTRGSPSSAAHSSPTPSVCYATPSQRPSPPPNKPSTPAPRSSTLTPRRISTGSGGIVSSSGITGISPVNKSRGNSASPKIRAWQTNILSFSLDAPHNLRTSLADRPASYVRGFSLASRNGRDSSSRGRQSMSPTVSRSVSSSHSHDRDRFSSKSKGFVASSGDDDVDSLQSVPLSSSDCSASRRVGAFPTSRAPAFSKKPTRTGLSSLLQKDLLTRHFDKWVCNWLPDDLKEEYLHSVKVVQKAMLRAVIFPCLSILFI